MAFTLFPSSDSWMRLSESKTSRTWETVGRELGVRALLLGRVAQHGDAVAISVELVDTSDGHILWRDQYHRRADELLAIQREIPNEILRPLRLQLSIEDQQRLAKPPTRDPEAYRLYMLGRYWWNKRSQEAAKKSASYFQQAIDKDPAYALAWVGLADVFRASENYSWMPTTEAYAKANAAAIRAIELDESLAEAHASIAAGKTMFEWDWAGAEREYRRAIELNPEYGSAHHWYALQLLALGRTPEALLEIRRACQLEPLSPIINANVGYYLYCDRQFGAAVQELQKAVEVDPSFAWTHGVLGRAYALQGKTNEAAAEFAQALTLSKRDFRELAFAASAAAYMGQRDEAKRLLEEILSRSTKQYIAAYIPALVYAGLGDRDQACKFVQTALQDRSIGPWLLRDPLWDGIRAAPQFQRLIQSMKLPP